MLNSTSAVQHQTSLVKKGGEYGDIRMFLICGWRPKRTEEVAKWNIPCNYRYGFSIILQQKRKSMTGDFLFSHAQLETQSFIPRQERSWLLTSGLIPSSPWKGLSSCDCWGGGGGVVLLYETEEEVRLEKKATVKEMGHRESWWTLVCVWSNALNHLLWLPLTLNQDC